MAATAATVGTSLVLALHWASTHVSFGSSNHPVPTPMAKTDTEAVVQGSWGFSCPATFLASP